MIQPRHFATHAMEGLALVRDRYLAKEGRLNRFVAACADQQIQHISRAIKFIGPTNGRFIERCNVADEDVDFPRLPFDAICLELALDLHDEAPEIDLPSPEGLNPDRVCVLAYYPVAGCMFSAVVRSHFPEVPDNAFLVVPIFGNASIATLVGATSPVWTPATAALLVVPHGCEVRSVRYHDTTAAKAARFVPLIPLERLDMQRQAQGLRVPGRPDLVTPSMDDARLKDVLIRSCIHDMAHEAIAVAEFCNVLECVNVSTETIPAPAAINAKRARAGKLPFFEYRVLTLPASSGGGEPLGGTHASPRLHYRRGHIRRLPGGKTWVRPTMVGEKSRGLIVKDYDTRPLAATTGASA